MTIHLKTVQLRRYLGVLQKCSTTLRTGLPIAPMRNQRYSFHTYSLIRNKTINEDELPSRLRPLAVPLHIRRPPYVPTRNMFNKLVPSLSTAATCKDKVTCMRSACGLAAEALQYALDLTQPGITGEDVEREVHALIVKNGGYPSPLGYKGFPKSLLISINEDGDIVKYDCVVYRDGHHGDCAATIAVGTCRNPTHLRLIQACKSARDSAIQLCRPGVPISRIGDCISAVASQKGFHVVGSLFGHFIGKHIHIPPYISHIVNDSQDIFEPGDTLTIEPVFTEGSPDLFLWKDKWSLATQDNGFGVHWEHTILVTEDEPEVLTALRDERAEE